ncbi:autotransporter outer membrane beta-barrel domain-containing protein, partial [Roseobacter sp. HKCCD5935]
MLDAPDNADNYAPITVEAWGVSGAAVRGADNTSGDIAVLLHHGSVTTDAVDEFNYNNHGLEAYTEGTGNATAQMNGGDVTTHTVLSYGLRAEIKNAGSNATAKAEMTEGRINIFEGSSSGLSAGTGSVGGAAIVEISGGTITTHGGGAHGIAASVNKNTGSAASATARMTGGLIRLYRENSHGVLVESNGGVVEGEVRAEALAEMSGGTIISRGVRDSHGVRARLYDNTANSKATATARVTRGLISTTGYRSAGISAAADASCDCDAIAEMNAINGSSTITTEGEQAHGIRAVSNNSESASEASAKAVMRNGSININGQWAHGISVQANGGLGSALAEMRGGTITTTHGGASAIYVRIHNEDHTNNSDNTNGATARMTGGTILTTNRVNAFVGSHGLHADTTGSADVVVEMKGGSITTLGRNSHGLWAEAEADAMVNGVRFVPGSTPQAKTIVKLDAGAVVTASGAGSNGIRVSGNYVTMDHNSNSPKFWLGVKEFDVDVAGIVTGGADGFNADDDGAAIRTISDAGGGGTIDIASTGRVMAGRSGLAIVDGAGASVITSAGRITGDIRLGAGDDTLIVTGGSIIGDVYGGEGDNTLTLEDGLLAGNIRLGAGDDSFTIASAANFDFSHVLDGGSGDNDHLTLHGRTMTSMGNVRNWEHLTLNDTHLSLDGMDRLDMGLSIDATSTFSASGGSRSTGATTAGKVANVPGGGITIAGDVTNAGEVTLSVQDGAAGDVIRVEGNYTNTGSGRSVFELDAVMGADGANTDRLEITGNASGEIGLSLAGLDSASAGGAPLAIYVVSVDGEADDATFTLMNGNHVMSDGEHGVISGAYVYRLAEVEAQDGRNWWALSARSESGEISWGPSAPIYDSYGAALLALNAPASLRNRGSSQDFRTLAWGGAGADAAGQDTGAPLWIQMGTEQLTSAAEQSTTGAARDSSLWEMEIGADLVLSESAAGLFVGGLMLSYGTGSTDVSSGFGDGSIETTGLGLGLAATWYDTRGFYVDGQVTVISYSSDL